MKVLHIINDLKIGGAQQLVCALLPLIANECEVELLVIHRSGDVCSQLNDPRVKIHYLDCHPRNPLVVAKLLRWLKRYDVVHVHLFPSSYFCAIASLFTRATLVFTEHSTNNRRREKNWLRPIEQFIYSRYKAIVTISDQTRDALSRWLQTDDKKLVTIENGICLEKYKQSEGNREDYVIMVSRFEPAKDQETLIRAMQYVTPALTLQLVGDGAKLEACRQLCTELGLNHRIRFLGTRTDVPQLVGRAKIGVQSSHWEGFGLTAIEMMAGGLPVVASRVEGLQQVVEGAGLLFDAGNERQLADCINSLFADREQYTATAEACRQRAQRYSIKNTAHNYVKLYHSICHKS
ncbi:MAG: glycosyltransferase [Bacteroidaceae bacterium]|nr:glycosyltransferase [Bacteroidaceae bacterium]